MTAALIAGQPELADWLWLIAAVVFVVAALLAWAPRPDPALERPRRWPGDVGVPLIPIGLALVAVAWLVL